MSKFGIFMQIFIFFYPFYPHFCNITLKADGIIIGVTCIFLYLASLFKYCVYIADKFIDGEAFLSLTETDLKEF